MKKWLKIGGMGCASVVLLVVLFYFSGYLIPAEMELKTDLEISASQETVFGYFDTQDGLTAWWTHIDETFAAEGTAMDMEVLPQPGPASGVGTRMDFGSNGEVTEHWVILKSTPPESVVYEIDFLVFKTERSITLVPVDANTTRVEWREIGAVANPGMRWMFFMMGTDAIIENFDHALAGVKRLAEGSATAP